MSYTKILIKGVIKVKTGLHIGGDDTFSAIGAIDSPVIRDPLTRDPIIPGSSLKGKMRSLLAREKGSIPAPGVKGLERDCPEIKRLFGSSSPTSNATGDGIQMSHLQFSDCFLRNKRELPAVFETKFENSIDRLTAVANPRQIERVIRGAEFDFEMIYNVEDVTQVEEDFKNIRIAMELLEHDYLGGGGSRGSGRIEFKDVTAEVVVGDASISVPELR